MGRPSSKAFGSKVTRLSPEGEVGATAAMERSRSSCSRSRALPWHAMTGCQLHWVAIRCYSGKEASSLSAFPSFVFYLTTQ
mmetsp:Transcript_6039/g.13342  ORF Transcript_6039/g.13342 Transcript_6039/m.13342 type:complete len:81 (+) Transcript_6039:2916-3158(+)